MKLPEFIYSATISNNTSLGRNKAFPPKEDLPYEYHLMKERFKDVVESIKNIFGYVPSVVEAEKLLNRFINQTMKIERPLRHQLEELCESVVNGVLSTPEETVLFSCELVDKIEPNKELRILPEDEEEEPTYTFNDVKEITRANDAILKRRMVNSLVQGVSYSLMSQALDTDTIRDWSPELMPLYEKVIALNDYLLFTKQEKITDKNPMLGAYVETDLGKGDEKTVISAQGLIYPLLLQESFRGFFELFASHGLPTDTKHALYIIRRADFIMAEAWDLRMGQALWNHINTNIGEVEYSVLPYLFSSIVQLSQDEFNETMQNILLGTNKGKSYIQDIVAAIEHDMEYQQFKKDINNIELDKTLIADDGIENNKMIEEEETNNNFVHSDNFKAWFGDWENNPKDASFVVGEHGLPILCYHSTEREFDEFDPNRIGSGGAGAYHGYGFNFTTQPNNTYGKFTKKVYLNARHPLTSLKKTLNVNKIISIIQMLDKDEMDSIACEFTGNYVKIGSTGYRNEIIKAAKQIYEYADSDLDIYANLSIASCCGPQKVIDVFSSLGFDSSAEYYDDGKLRVVVVFNKNQIMSVPQNLDESVGNSINSWFHGSHVVNPDGTPKLMYRGDNNEITTFDRQYSASSNLYGTGFYFTGSKSHAAQYGNAQAYYLKITHPLSTEGHEITKQQLYKFLVAVDENEDYGLYNYGYGANPKTVLNSVWGKSDFAMLLDINACCIGDLVEATLLFNQLNDTDFDGFILDTETVVFDNSQIRKANITESKQYITEGKVDKQAEKRCYDVIKQGNSWLQPVMDNPCNETDAQEGMTNFQYEYKEIRDHWVRNNVKFAPVVMNILYNQLGYRGISPKVDEIDNFKKILTLINADKRYASMPWNEAINYSYEDWYNIFKVVMENEERMEDAEINNLQHSGNDYEIIKVNTCEESRKYGNYSGGGGSKLCYTQSQSTWDNYTNNGQYSCYVCLKNGWQSIKPIPGEDSPMDEYGLSMIFVFVNKNGRLTTSNTRWNHGHVDEYNQKHGTNKTVDKFLSRLEISKIVGVNFMETFKGKNSVSFEEATQKILSLDDWFEISQYCDSYQIMEGKQMIVEINGKYNLLDFKNKKFHFNEWCDLIVNRGSSYILCYTRGQNFVYNIKKNKVVLQNSPYSIVHAINDTFFEVKIDDNHENIYNAQTKQLINNDTYTDVNPWNNFFQVFKGTQSSFINENGEYIINDWFDLVFEPPKNHMDKYVVCKKGDKFNVLSYNQDTIKLLSEEWFDGLDYREFFGRVVVDSFPEHGSRYCMVINNDVTYALFPDGYIASFWQACVIGTQKANQIDELGTEIWNYMDSNPRFGDTALDAMKRFYYNEDGYPSLKDVAEDYAYIKLEEKYGNDEDVDNSNVEQELHQLTSDYHLALQKTAIYYFNYNPIEETRTHSKKQLKEYLDKQYMKPLWDYLKAGDRYSSGGNYTPSERLIIPFFEWACNQLNKDEFKQFGKALINCPQLHEKLKPVIRNGHQAIECYSQMTDGLQKVRTRDFLKQNAKRLFTITYNDPNLSLYWDKFYFFINGKEGHQQLKKGQYLDADTVLMNPEIKKPMWLVHFTSNEEDALNICKNGFKYGLEPHQMSRLGYTNKDINREDKNGKFAYAYNAEEITDGFFPSDFIIPKEQWRFDNNFDQKVWENAIHYCIMFVAPGIEVRHDTDAQQQVIFNTDTARDYVLLSFSMINNNVLWNVCSIDGRTMYNNKSLTKVIKWVVTNFNQYKRYICQKH